MAEEWKRAEILLEEIKKDVKAIAEGHSVLDRKIDTRFEEVKEQFGFIEMILKEHGTILDEIKNDLKEHIQQAVPPAHVAF